MGCDTGLVMSGELAVTSVCGADVWSTVSDERRREAVVAYSALYSDLHFVQDIIQKMVNYLFESFFNIWMATLFNYRIESQPPLNEIRPKPRLKQMTNHNTRRMKTLYPIVLICTVTVVLILKESSILSR